MKRNRWIDGVNHSLDRHAFKRLRERNININQVWETAEDPDEYEDAQGEAIRLSKMYGDKKLQLIVKPISDFILISTVYYESEYSEDKRATAKSKLVAARERYNRNARVHNNRYRKRTKSVL